MKKLASLLLIAALLLSCLSSLAAAESSLTFAVTSDPSSLFPYGANRGGKQATRTLLYEPLFWIDADGVMQPILAKSYENLGDGVYEVTIFDYIYDSAGNHMTASDVVYSLELYIADGKQPANYSALTSYEATGEYTIRLTFGNEHLGNFEALVTNLYCITQAAWEASPDQMMTTPVGTGRYALKDFKAATSYTFVKRDNYWQTDESYIVDKNKANIDELNLKIITDTSTIAVALEKGEIDYTQNIEDADRPNFRNEDGTAKAGYVSKGFDTSNFVHLTFNCSENSPCADINLRKAICYAVDASAIAFNIQGSNGEVMKSCLVPTVLDADYSLYAKEDYYGCDFTKAAEYLAKSNYKGETLRILVKPNINTNTAGTLIMAYCNAIGINVELLAYESALYTEYSLNEDSTLYDIDLTGLSGTDNYAWKSLYELDINSYSGVTNHNFIYDETLQNLYDVAANAATGGPEASAALADYVDENCYIYSLYTYDVIYFGRDRITKIANGGANQESLYNAFELAD